MCKKLLIAGVAVVLGLLVVRKTEVGSHLRALWKDGKNLVKNSISIDSEIERLRGDISRLDQVYRTQFHPVATEQVSVENLRQEIVRIEKKLEEQKSDIETMSNDVKSGGSFITYGDVKYSRDQVKNDLTRRFAAYKTCETGLKAKKELLEAKEEKLTQALTKLDTMKTAKTEMEAELARLEAKYESVKVAKAKSKSDFQIDDSELARIKASMSELDTRVQIEQKECELAGQFINKVNPKIEKAAANRDVVKEIEDHFNKNEVKVGARVNPGN